MADLFDELVKVSVGVETRQRVVTEKFVWLMGEKFEIVDLLDLLGELVASPSWTHVTDDRVANMLRRFGLITHSTPSWGTRIADEARVKQLHDMVLAAYRETPDAPC